MGDTLNAGTRVKHVTRTDWGLGEVLNDAQNGRVWVYFEDVGVKEFDLSAARFTIVDGDESSSDYLTGLVLHWKKQGATTTSSKNPSSSKTTFKGAIAKFLGYFPDGFYDQSFDEREREYKVTAHKLLRTALGKEALTDLLEKKDFGEICNRVKTVANKTNLICPYEKIWLSNGLSTQDAQQSFARSLNALLHGSSSPKERFECFANTLYEINAAKWPVATYFGFVYDPESQVFLKPEATKGAAEAIGLEISYRPEVNWLTYRSVLDLANAVKEKLMKENNGALVPRDMIDVQSFIWVASSAYN